MEAPHNDMDSFYVRESSTTNIICGIVFSILFFISLSYDNYSSNNLFTNFNILNLTIIPAIAFFAKAGSNRNILEINIQGIYYYDSLITPWENFIYAEFVQEELNGSIAEKERLYIEYFKPDKGLNYTSKIRLTNTQDKSAEEIIDAIKKFTSIQH